MKHQKTLFALALIASATVTGTAQASLVDRGNGMIYDNVLNLTWLQDANYAKTSGYASATGGRMDWYTATTWATNLNYNGLTGWRLATNTPINGSSFNYNLSNDGSTDVGYNITSPKSELAYMYNVNLGLKDYVGTSGTNQSNYGVFGNGTTGGQANVGLVHNLQSDVYWSGAEYSPGSVYAWNFRTSLGYQDANGFGKNGLFYAWAVRSGDVAAVPAPAAIWLFGSGLMGLLGFKRRKAA
jgi:hypothetical protein